MIIDHIWLAISDVEVSKEFFIKSLAPLDISVVMEFAWWVGMGKDGKPDLWFWKGKEVQSPMHIAFIATSRAQVDAFYDAALAAGGTDNGKPGERKEYHEGYYGAFVLWPDGHNIEAVFHG